MHETLFSHRIVGKSHSNTYSVACLSPGLRKKEIQMESRLSCEKVQFLWGNIRTHINQIYDFKKKYHDINENLSSTRKPSQAEFLSKTHKHLLLHSHIIVQIANANWTQGAWFAIRVKYYNEKIRISQIDYSHALVSITIYDIQQGI